MLPEFDGAVIQPSRHHGVDPHGTGPEPSGHANPHCGGRKHGKVGGNMGQMVERLLAIPFVPGLEAMVDLPQQLPGRHGKQR
ncbi:hypothetical protein D3C81_2223160 [compost metagenome]